MLRTAGDRHAWTRTRRAARAAFTLGAALAGAPALRAQPVPLGKTSLGAGEPPAAVERLLAGVGGDGAPGCAAAASQDGRPLFARARGLASLELGVPLTPETVFPTASISKQFTAFAVLLLARDGRLSLDDDVRRWVPELPDFGAPITVRHLLTHTSGLRDHWELLRLARGRLFENRVTQADALDVVVRQRALNHAPGADWYYSATGYTLAALVVRRVTGQSLRDFARQRLFEPLGMRHTQFQDDATAVVPGRATGYYRGSDGAWHAMPPHHDVAGPTGLTSTVGDLLRWQANVARPVVGDSAMVRAMEQAAVLASGEPTGYGLGLFVDSYRGARMFTHGGDDVGYHGATARFPELGLAVAVLCNADGTDPTGLLIGVVDALAGARLGPPEPPAVARVRVTRADLAPLAGVYADGNGRPMFVAVRNDSLVAADTTGPPLVPLGTRRFRRADREITYDFAAPDTLVVTRPWFPRRTAYARRARPAVTPAWLAEHAGTYVSDELGAAYAVAPGDGGLTLRGPSGRVRRLRPVYGEWFDGADQVSFTRDAAGRVDGLLMHNVRLRNLRFRRAEGPQPNAAPNATPNAAR